VFDVCSENDPELARTQVQAIPNAIAMLGDRPLIGRLVKHGLRELVIARGETRFVLSTDSLPIPMW
jgi:plasmid stabilization system protein ParE